MQDPTHPITLPEKPALEGLEMILVNGLELESFTTSGGLGTMCETYLGRVQELNYKTMRYPGHCELMRFLLNELYLRLSAAVDDCESLFQILFGAIFLSQDRHPSHDGSKRGAHFMAESGEKYILCAICRFSFLAC